MPQTQDLRRLRQYTLERLRLAAESQKVLLVIDGLDEAAGWAIGTDLFPPSTLPNLRILIAARPSGEQPNDWSGTLGWDIRGVAQKMELSSLSRAGVADVLMQMGNPLAPLAARFDLVNALFQKSEGDPLIVGLYVEELFTHIGNIEGFSVDDFENLQPGLRGFFQYWLADQIKLWGEDRHIREQQVRQMMALCALAHGPLTYADFRELAPESFDTRINVERTATDLRRLVTRINDGVLSGFVFSHPRFRDFVADELLEDAERGRFSNVFLEYCRKSVTEFMTGRRQRPSEYAVRWFTTHVIASTQSPTNDFQLVLDQRWCEEWQRIDGTAAGFLSDLDRIWLYGIGSREVAIKIWVSLICDRRCSTLGQIDLVLLSKALKAHIIDFALLAEVIARQQRLPEDVVLIFSVSRSISANRIQVAYCRRLRITRRESATPKSN